VFGVGFAVCTMRAVVIRLLIPLHQCFSTFLLQRNPK